MSFNLSKLPLKRSQKKYSFNPYLFEVGIFFFIALATVIINWKMIQDGSNGMIDLKWHLTWLQHFSKQLAEGIWYPRWLAGTNYGYGSPTFVFYPPLVYYIGSLFKFSGLNTENTIIALFSGALFLSGFNFYIYGRSRWGILPSLVGAIAYMSTPYLALDIYWRGGLASIFAQAWIPLIWWLTEKALVRPKVRAALALSWTTLALTHTPSLLLCLFVWLPYTLFFLLARPWKAVVGTISSAGIGLGIASLYLLPAILEKPFVNIEVMRWKLGGFQANVLGAGLPIFTANINELVSIQYIFLHQSSAIALFTIIVFVWCRKNVALVRETGRWLVFAIVLAFFMSSLSIPIWKASTTLQMVQFPWRLLQFFSFVGAVLCTVTVSGILKLKSRLKFVLSLIILGILLVNFRYSYKLSRQFITLHHQDRDKVQHLGHIVTILEEPYTDKLRDVEEYRPLLKNGLPSPPTPLLGQPKFSLVNGQANIDLLQWESYKRIFQVTAEKTSTIRVRTYYYPAWHLYLNNQPHPINISDDGTIKIKLNPGSYKMELRYQWTPAFKIGIALSILSIIVLILYWLNTPVMGGL